VAVADHLIRHNTQRKDKKLHTELGEGEKPRVVRAGAVGLEALRDVVPVLGLEEDA
jgi:superfamily I DNA/RNA helicase